MNELGLAFVVVGFVILLFIQERSATQTFSRMQAYIEFLETELRSKK